MRLLIYQQHVCTIPDKMLKEWQRISKEIKVSSWFRKMVYQEFNFKIESADDIDTLKSYCDELFYDSIGEWVKDLMRREILNNHDDNGKWYAYRITSNQVILYLCRDTINELLAKEPIYTWTTKYSRAEVFRSHATCKKIIESNFSKNLDIKYTTASNNDDVDDDLD